MKHLAMIALTLGLLAGCAGSQTATSRAAMQIGKPVMLFNLTSDPMADPHSLTMGLQLANLALDDGRAVVLFFNVKSVALPTQGFPADVKEPHAQPLKQMLSSLIAKGAQAHVCPMCMKAKGITADQLVNGAQVTSSTALFGYIGPDTVVFTY